MMHLLRTVPSCAWTALFTSIALALIARPATHPASRVDGWEVLTSGAELRRIPIEI